MIRTHDYFCIHGGSELAVAKKNDEIQLFL